jgi:hypothetical protein
MQMSTVIYRNEDADLPERLYWDGPGLYATKQAGSHQNAYYETRQFAEVGEWTEADKQARHSGFGSPFEVTEAYGDKE